MIDVGSSSSVEMVDLTQDSTENQIDEQTNIKEKKRAIPERRKETLKPGLAIDPAKGFSKGLQRSAVEIDPGKRFSKRTLKPNLVISPAAKKKILEMALGQSVSTFHHLHITSLRSTCFFIYLSCFVIGQVGQFHEGPCTYYVITDRGGGSLQMITVLHRGGPANDYGITWGWCVK